MQIELNTQSESRSSRIVYGLLAVLLAVGFLVAMSFYWVPAHPGTDQNGYLFGGRQISKTLTMRFAPTRPGTSDFDPHQFVGRMWVGADLGTPQERYYPKYPIGLPAIYAVMLWIGSLFKSGTGIILAYWVNPVAMSLAVLGTYRLVKLFVGSLLGFLAAVVFASSPVTNGLATNPNSHATAVCLVTWGMFLLFTYWKNPDAKWATLRALGAGLLLGYTATIRYSEATLFLPIALVSLFVLLDAIFNSRRLTAVAGTSASWTLRSRIKSCSALLIGWAVPVALLVAYNRGAMGTNTGYDPTNESTGFQLSYAVINWETMFRQLDTYGLSLVLPLSLAALIWMFWWNWRIAAVLSAWIVPCMLTYTFYYWAPDATLTGYLRFFTTILPALGLCFFWLIDHLHEMAKRFVISDRQWWMAFGVSVAVTILMLPIVWLSSVHLWLGDYDPAAIGIHSTHWIIRLLTPKDADIDFGAIREARVAFAATFTWALVGATFAGLVVLAIMRGRSSLPIVGGALLAGLVAAMHLTNSIPAMENDQLQRVALASNVDEMQAIAPEGSIIVGSQADQGVLDDLQFKGDYDLCDGSTFSAAYIQTLPSAEPPDSPQGLDPGRRDALYNRLKNFDQNGLDEQARQMVVDALAQHRRVFVIVQRRDADMERKEKEHALKAGHTTKKVDPMIAMKKNLERQMPDLVQRLCTNDRLEFDVAGTWITYTPRLIEPSKVPRGVRLANLQPVLPRRGMELIELTMAPVAEAR